MVSQFEHTLKHIYGNPGFRAKLVSTGSGFVTRRTANGALAFGTFDSGNSCFDPATNTFFIRLNGTFTGRTGQFAGATGNLTSISRSRVLVGDVTMGQGFGSVLINNVTGTITVP